MRIRIFSVGRFKSDGLCEIFKNYQKRISCKIELIEEPERKFSDKKLSWNQLPDKIKKTKIIALDETGENLSSKEFAQKFEKLKLSAGDITFLIGPAQGMDQSLLERANLKISFGKMTYPHLLARVMLIEQIYRAECILSGHPYHKE